jgi:hypothetical protein
MPERERDKTDHHHMIAPLVDTEHARLSGADRHAAGAGQKMAAKEGLIERLRNVSTGTGRLFHGRRSVLGERDADISRTAKGRTLAERQAYWIAAVQALACKAQSSPGVAGHPGCQSGQFFCRQLLCGYAEVVTIDLGSSRREKTGEHKFLGGGKIVRTPSQLYYADLRSTRLCSRVTYDVFGARLPKQRTNYYERLPWPSIRGDFSERTNNQFASQVFHTWREAKRND